MIKVCCANCCNKYIDMYDNESKCWCCGCNDDVICMYDQDGKLQFHSCLNFKSYEDIGPLLGPIVKFIDEVANDLY